MSWLKKIFRPSQAQASKPSAAAPTHPITDDSGFLAIIDPDAYEGFVHREWTWEMMQEHFLREMCQGRLLIWGTGLEHTWPIQVSLQPTKASGFREIIGGIIASNGRFLTNYESLTMAARSADRILPQEHERNQVVPVPTGIYDCRIIQLSDPESDAPFEEMVGFIYEFTPTTSRKPAWTAIPWIAV